MPHYPKYTTTVIGAYSVPRWFEPIDRLVTMGQLLPADMADAQFRVMQAAVFEQEIAGIDVITGGETHRRTHNRHAPLNAMLNHYWQKIPAFQGDTRPKSITKYDPNVTHPAAICKGPITDMVDLGLVGEFETVSGFARKPVKITMTGPHLLAAVAHDEYYNDTGRMIADFGKLLHQNFGRLAAAGKPAKTNPSMTRTRPMATMNSDMTCSPTSALPPRRGRYFGAPSRFLPVGSPK